MEGRCRKHPSHKQSKGVCPSCLRQKLSEISASAASTNTTPSSYSSGVTSSSSDGPSSPGRRRRRRRRRRRGRKLKKSRSLACVPGIDAGGRGGTGTEKKGGTGFWKRLLGMEWRAKKRGEEETEVGFKAAVRSHTVKETSSARWLF